jgi:threonine dehydrogenase-like Zn-dependent dehydrogenase
MRVATATPRRDATAVFTAATGTVGTAAICIAKFFGVKRFIAVARSTERLQQVRQLAPKLVETIAFDRLSEDWGEHGGLTDQIRRIVPNGSGAVIDFLPEAPGTWQAVASLKTGGTAVLMGANPSAMPLTTVAIMRNCWRIHGTRNCTREDARQILAWIDEGALRLDDLITHRFQLHDIGAATRAVVDRSEPTWMVVANP